MHPLSRGARSPLRGDESKGRVPLVLVEILQKNVRRRSPGGRRGGRSQGPSWPILTGREKLRARRLCEVLSLRRSGRHPLRPRGGAPGRAGRQTGASHHFKRAFKGRMTRADSDRWCTTPGRLAREAGGRAVRRPGRGTPGDITEPAPLAVHVGGVCFGYRRGVLLR